MSSSDVSCVEQDKKFNSIFVLGILLSNVFTILYGAVLDTFGMTQARVATGIPLTAGLTMMIFYEDRQALEIGTYLLSVSCCGTLISNYAIQSIWPKKTSTIGYIYSGMFDGSLM